MARLLTIGDSISQGFMSGGAARPEVCYSTFVAQALGVRDYRHSTWPKGGIPLNFEVLLRNLSRYFGDDIWGPFEWSGAAIRISNFIDSLEDYYERADGDYRRPAGVDGFHNLSSFGFTVSDAWEVTPDECLKVLEPGGVRPVDDERFATPSDAFYRSAFRTLNPSVDDKAMGRSQLGWVEHYAKSDRDGVENLIIWLGANNALGTILDLKINETATTRAKYKGLKHADKGGFNLWTEELFEADYRQLIERTRNVLADKQHTKKQPHWRVFLGTVPAITIAPLAKGVGRTETRQDPFGTLDRGAAYFEHYTYMVFNEDAVKTGDVRALSRDEAYRIDQRINGFNTIIKRLAKEQNDALGEERFLVADINDALLRLALKRNRGNPTYELPAALKQGGRALVDTRYYHAQSDRMTAGGVFSLDGVHPSVIGQALVADEFMKIMRQAKRKIPRSPIDWDRIMLLDDLFARPVDLIQEIYQHDRLARLLIGWLRTPDD